MKRFLTLLVVASTTSAARAQTMPGWPHGAVASVNRLATEAGVAAMKRGGNAVDAAIATALTLGVVDGHNSGLGGGCFILIRTAKKEVIALDGRETAPALATRDMYLRHGKADETLSKTGGLASGTPGALAAYALAEERYGRLGLKDLIEPAERLAEEGFVLDATYARKIQAVAESLRQFEGSAKLFFKADGSPLKEGDKLRQPDLAKTLRAIAADGPAAFYQGAFADTVDAWMQKHGGVLRKADFAHYAVKLREPLHTTYRGYDVWGFPPPSSGGVHVAEMLNILETFDLATLSMVQRTHVIAEAMKRAFADRAFWLGDPAFVKVPRGLVDKAYAIELARQIHLDTAIPVPQHGSPPQAEQNVFSDTLGKHTTHLSTADAEGNWVALTQTVNTAFGSKVVVPGTGVVLNDEMDDFSIAPGVPNAFKLVGAAANAVAPGKRPLSSMSPTIIVKDGHPILSVGAAGGPTIISQTLLAIVGVLDLHLDVKAALAQPRLHHQWSPDELKIESGFPPEVLEGLRKLGHRLDVQAHFGACQAVSWDEAEHLFRAASDPRLNGLADGW
jgi:gamma-glutamyltranspeptidase/glutathione hydrolase